MIPEMAVTDLGRLAYGPAYDEQVRAWERVAAMRGTPGAPVGEILLVEHDPVITVSRRPTAAGHVLATAEALASHGVTVHETDRGGDVTYHGPGQLVAYPILDLNRLGLGLHDYMRLLEGAVIRTIGAFGLAGFRDSAATGVWVKSRADGVGKDAKICAMGVRVRRWITMHGLALNVTTNLDHFGLIVPCGLVGRGVTSMQRELGAACPEMCAVKSRLVDALRDEVGAVRVNRGR